LFGRTKLELLALDAGKNLYLRSGSPRFHSSISILSDLAQGRLLKAILFKEH
jgi:hypothetical protein